MKQLVLLIGLLLIMSVSPLLASIIENTCKSVTRGKERYNFCVTTFQASPKSRSADLRGLSLIGLDLALDNHTYNLNKAMKLQEQGRLPDTTKQCIDMCVQMYIDANTALNEAMQSAEEGLSFRTEIAGAATLVADCRKQFKEAGQKDLLAKENYNAFTLDYIMGGIDILLHRRRS